MKTRQTLRYLVPVMKWNMESFRVFAPDENTSNKLDALYQASKKFWIAESFPEDRDGTELASDGRVVEMLSEHTMHLADLNSYLTADGQLSALYANSDEWARKAILNVAGSGKFSSDRTIAEYAKEIWNVKPCPIPEKA